ncbi:MAG TPA: hypothetical protein VLM89_17480, partial [Phycisphaerae bacterium]|nr:hypothetical protein [Phycisphaerae bacterium]
MSVGKDVAFQSSGTEVPVLSDTGESGINGVVHRQKLVEPGELKHLDNRRGGRRQYDFDFVMLTAEVSGHDTAQPVGVNEFKTAEIEDHP